MRRPRLSPVAILAHARGGSETTDASVPTALDMLLQLHRPRG